MTKKLKKQINKIAYVAFAIIVTAITVLCLNAEVFVMPMSLGNIEKTGIGESVSVHEGTNALSDGGVVQCESIVQGARDNDLSDRKLYFQSNRNRQ